MADNTTAVDSVIGTNVKIFLMVRGQSQTALGKKLGLQRSTMSKKINGKVIWTANDVLEASQFLDVPVQRLFNASAVQRFNKDFA